jgi:hypothetical protein
MATTIEKGVFVITSVKYGKSELEFDVLGGTRPKVR